MVFEDAVVQEKRKFWITDMEKVKYLSDLNVM